jgi:hypothetical protein
MSYTSEVLADSPRAYLKLDDTSGTPANSGSATLTNWTLTNLTYGVTGKFSQAIQQSSGTMIFRDGSTYNASAAWSLEFWFKYSGSGSTRTLVYGKQSGGVATFNIQVTSDGRVGTTMGSNSDYSTTTYNDGAWHHLVFTCPTSGSWKTYIDGVQKNTGSQSAINSVVEWQFGYPSDGGTIAYDMVATYGSTLASGRVTAHYTATEAVSVTVDVLTATSTAQAQDPTFTISAGIVDVTTVTATAQAQDAAVSINVATTVVTQTVSAQANNVTVENTKVVNVARNRDFQVDNNTDDISPMNANAAPAYIVMDFDLPSDLTNTGLISAVLHFKNTSGSNFSPDNVILFNQITAEWADSDITHTVGTTLPWTYVSGQYQSVDLTSIFNKNNFYGVKLSTNPADVNKAVGVYSDGTDYPYMTFSYAVVPESETVDVPTATISVAAQDVSASANAEIVNNTVTTSLMANDVTVEANVSPDVIIDVSTLTVSVQAQDASVALPTVVDVSTQTVSAMANDATVEVTQGVDFTFDTPVVNLRAIKPADINGEPIEDTEGEDRYFVSTMLNLDEGDVWWRLDEKSGTEVHNRAWPEIPSPGQGTGVYHNVTIGLSEGIDGRHSVQFNGTGYITENEATTPGDNEQFTIPSSLEFTFRTERATQFLMGGADAIKPAGAGSPTEVGGSEFWLQDGKINFRAYNLGNPNTPFNQQPPLSTNILGFKNLADGDWHHIVVNMGGLNAARGGRYIEIWVDGFLEIRRFAGVTGTGPNETTETSNIYFGMPDWVGGRPANSFDQWRFLPAIPIAQANFFLGDMTEIIFRNGQLLSEDYILLQDDMMFGRDPVYPETARMSTKAYDATAKGNKKRMLVIDMADGLGTESYYNDIIVGSGPTVDVWGNVITDSSAGQFHFTGPGNNMGRGLQNSDDLYGYQVFKVHARNNYLDNVTDNERVLDLDLDLNMDDYDVISVVDYPHTDAAWAWFDGLDAYSTPPFITGRRQVEHLVAQIREQVVEGKSLFISDPDLALAIGVIDRYEFVPNMREHDFSTVAVGSNSGYYDFRGAQIDPWNGDFGSTNPRIGTGYEDQHANTRQRVRALVPGLTDIPGHITTDFISWYNYDPMGTPPYNETFKYEARDEGLTVGDEFYLLGAVGPSDLDLTAEILGKDRTSARLTGWLATPPGHVVAGKMVTSFADKVYNFDRIENNPYRDYASSIVVEPGDEIKGQTITGKIYVNFTEAWTEWAPFMETKRVQVIPPNDQLPLPLRQTEEMRKWSWSTHRGSWTGTSYQDNGAPQIILNPDGSIGGVEASKPGSAVVRFNWSGYFPTVPIYVPSMAFRGFKWLAEIETVESGSVIIGTETATVTAQTSGDSVTTQKGTTVELQTARITAEAYADADTVGADVSVLVTTATLVAFAGAFIEIVDLDTARITTKAYDDLDVGFAEDNVLTLTLPFHNLTLYMEES